MDLIRQLATNALRELRAGNIEDGLHWLRGYTERYTNVHTRGMLEAALDGRFAEVISSLEHQLKWSC
jgi:hypothetical protein